MPWSENTVATSILDVQHNPRMIVWLWAHSSELDIHTINVKSCEIWCLGADWNVYKEHQAIRSVMFFEKLVHFLNVARVSRSSLSYVHITLLRSVLLEAVEHSSCRGQLKPIRTDDQFRWQREWYPHVGIWLCSQWSWLVFATLHILPTSHHLHDLGEQRSYLQKPPRSPHVTLHGGYACQDCCSTLRP